MHGVGRLWNQYAELCPLLCTCGPSEVSPTLHMYSQTPHTSTDAPEPITLEMAIHNSGHAYDDGIVYNQCVCSSNGVQAAFKFIASVPGGWEVERGEICGHGKSFYRVLEKCLTPQAAATFLVLKVSCKKKKKRFLSLSWSLVVRRRDRESADKAATVSPVKVLAFHVSLAIHYNTELEKREDFFFW